MNNPTFRLEGVVKAREESADFEGPLTLILQLLSKNKIEIRDIQISLILDQYLAYLDEMASMDLEIASEFVAMASHLVYIKTRMLLSIEEETSELDQLISSLEALRCKDIYTRIQAVTDDLRERYRRGGGTVTKPPEPLEADRQYRYAHRPDELSAAIRRVFDRGEFVRPHAGADFVQIMQKPVYSISQKAEEIVSRLARLGPLRVADFYERAESRTELIAAFMALLELCKAGSILLTEKNGEILAAYTGVGMDFEALDECEGGQTDGHS